MQTTVTPAWTKPGYDSSGKPTATHLTSPGGEEEEKNIPKKQANAGRMEKDVTVQLNTFFFFTEGITFDIQKYVRLQAKRKCHG